MGPTPRSPRPASGSPGPTGTHQAAAGRGVRPPAGHRPERLFLASEELLPVHAHLCGISAFADALASCENDEAYYAHGLDLLIAGVRGLRPTA
jgi:hypothetical protein